MFMALHTSSLFFYFIFLIWYECISVAENNCGMVEENILSSLNCIDNF